MTTKRKKKALIVWMPYKKGYAIQYWNAAQTKRECSKFLTSDPLSSCWEGFKPKKYKITEVSK